MPRVKRKTLKFDESSLNELLQEIYNDTHNIRAKINRLFTKWEIKVKEGGEIAALGDQVVKLIQAEAKNQDQKIMILKYLKEVVFATKKETSDTESANETTSKRSKDELLKMVQAEMDKEKIENKKK